MWGRRRVFSYCSSFLKPSSYYSNSNNRTSTTIVAAATTTGDPSGSSKTKMAMSSIAESDVGISCYISNLPGFRGILKQRYSDFIVNEVDLDGNVVHLTSLESPPESVQIVEEKESKTTQPLNKSYESEIQLFRSLACESDAECLKNLVDQITSGNKEIIEAAVLSPDSNKAHRTEIHNFFKEKFKFLVTDTVDGPDASSKCIRVRLSTGSHSNGRNSKKRKDRGDKPFDSRGSSSWPEHIGKFLKFHLYKENKDTQEALGIVGKMLGVQSRSFGFAGTKDKRSVSTQRVTVFKQSASKLAALNEKLIGIKVGDFCYVKEGLLLGQLQGNRFTTTLRGVVADSEDTIKAAANLLEKHGFINYFGLQRFGSGSVPTHLIGAALLRGEWKTAVDMILDPREGEKDMIAKAREYCKESGDIEGTLRQLPRHLVAERAILQCLKKCPGNHLQAVQAIPRTLRMMYVHSYQSYLWNHAASARVQKYGSEKIVVGDLVYRRRDDGQPLAGFINPEYKDENSLDVHDCIDLDESSGVDLAVQGEVRAVTSEDILSGNYTVDDVVLPLPGSRVVYPNNDVSEVYSDMARKDQINLRESLHNVKDFSITSMTGAYRRVFQKPMDYQWKIIHYSDCNLPLADTDLDMIAKSPPNGKGKNPGSGVQYTNQLDSASHCNDESGACMLANTTKDDGTEPLMIQTALQLAFTLPASCYATMAIRELLKSSTSVAFHKKLNQETPLSLET